MSKATERLSATFVKSAKGPRRYHDGGGLYLQVSQSGARSWIFKYQSNKKGREMGLGPFPAMSLADARMARREYQGLLATGLDPLEARCKARLAQPAKPVGKPTFRECAENYITDKTPEWKSVKHAKQWSATLSAHAYPHIGDLPVDQIGTDEILAVLKPIWTVIPKRRAAFGHVLNRS